MKHFLLISLTILAAITFSSCTQPEDSWDGYYFVKYAVTGNVAAADVTVLNEFSSFDSIDSAALPWEITYKYYCGTSSSSFAVASISAIHIGAVPSNSLTASIYNKKHPGDEYMLFAENTATGNSPNVSITQAMYP